MTHKFARNLFLAASCAAMFTLPLSADSLENLINTDGSLQVGDVVFSDFTFAATCYENGKTANCAALINAGDISGFNSENNPGSIAITADTSNGMDGFEITSSLKTTSDGTNSYGVDISLTYDANIVGSTNEISDVYLGATALLNPPCLVGQTCPPTPSVTIEETVDNTSGGFLNLAQVTDPPPSLSDQIAITPVTGVEVTKDIDLNSGAGMSGGTDDYASSTTIIQQLSQVPEPRAYAAVLGLFFALFFVVKRRRQQTA